MTQDDLWAIYCDGNPQFANSKRGATVTMSVVGLKKLFDTTWAQAYQSGKENGSKGYQTRPKYSGADLPKGFDEIFGGFNKR